MADEDESDYQDSLPGPSRRRNKRKIVMRIEYGDSDSSTEEIKVVRAKQQQQQNKTELHTAGVSKPKDLSEHSEWEQDWMSDHGEDAKVDESAAGSSKSAVVAKIVPEDDLEEEGHSSDSSTSSNGRDKCPICLFTFTTQEVGKPENCDHKFCAICIEEWSKNVSTCPIDRKEFLKIICLQDYNTPDVVTREISVEVTNKYETADDVVFVDGDEDQTPCRICSRADREDSMLLCDGCNQGYHMECLVPALQEIPAEFWYCDDCFASNDDDDPDDELALQEEIAELMDEVREYGIPETRLRIRTETVPRILRTRQSERIRDAIMARTNRRGFREATREVPAEDSIAMPGPSRMHTSVRIVRSMTTTTTTIPSGSSRSSSTARRSTTSTSRRAPAQRRRVNRRKTVVVEYDVDNEDDKFAMKTKKIYKKIKRRRKKRRQETSRVRIFVCFDLYQNATRIDFQILIIILIIILIPGHPPSQLHPQYQWEQQYDRCRVLESILRDQSPGVVQ